MNAFIYSSGNAFISKHLHLSRSPIAEVDELLKRDVALGIHDQTSKAFGDGLAVPGMPPVSWAGKCFSAGLLCIALVLHAVNGLATDYVSVKEEMSGPTKSTRHRKRSSHHAILGEKDACSKHDILYGQVQQDLLPFRISGITHANMIATRDWCVREPAQFVCCAIVNGTLYLTTLPWREGDLADIHYAVGFLLELYDATLQFKMPDVEFAVHSGDFPKTKLMNESTRFGPSEPVLFSYSKTLNSPDILVPGSPNFRLMPDSFDKLLAEVLQQRQQRRATAWTAKKGVVFGRYSPFCIDYLSEYPDDVFSNGKRRPCARQVLHNLTDDFPQQLDIRNAAEPHEQASYLPYVPLLDQQQFRFLASTDGWGVSAKLEKSLLLGSVVLKQASPLHAFFYRAMAPWVHYAPFYQHDERDIMDTLAALAADDELAQRIAANGAKFAFKHLNRHARMCYYREVITQLSKLFRYQPSCVGQELCVPALEELVYLGHFFGEEGHELESGLLAQLRRLHGGQLPPSGKSRHQPANTTWPETPPYFHGFSNGGYMASAYKSNEQ